MERPFFATASIALTLLCLASLPLSAQEPAPEPAQPTVKPDPASPSPIPQDPAAPAMALPATPPAPRKDRVTFDIAMQASQGGGRATGSAGEFEYEDGRFLIATGGVELKYRELKLVADRVRVDIPANKLQAEGKVILDEGPRRISGTTLEYDLTTRTGRITDAIASMDPDYYFRGSEIAKIGPNTYTITNGVFTSCNQEVPSWSIALSKATVTLEEYARITNARLRFKKLPVLYFPYLIWPATTERTSGFLIPKPGYSDRRGVNLSLAYYKTLGRSADATFYADLSQEAYNGLGTEFRWRPSDTSQGGLEAYFLSEPDDAFLNDDIFDPDRQRGDNRWKFLLAHEDSNLWNDFRGVVSIQQYSDFDYLKDIERSVDRQTQSFVYSTAFLSRNVGQSSFNILVDERERILGNRGRDLRRQLPEVEYKLRPTRLGKTPIYFSLDSSLHYFSVELSDPPPADGSDAKTDSFRYGRAHVKPALSIPLSTLPWLSVKVDLEGRATYWTDSVDNTGQAFSGDSLTRVVPVGAAEIVGPSFSKIYDSPGGRYSKFKHVIEPRFDYGYVGTYDDQDRVSIFDEIDFFSAGHFWSAGVYNRLLAKPSDEKEGGAFTIASLLIAQAFNLDDQPGQSGSGPDPLTTAEGPLFAELQINPSRTTSVKADLQYNTLFSRLQNFNFSGSTKLGEHAIGATWYKSWNAETGEDASDQMRLFLDAAVIPGKLNVGAELSYDARLSELLSQRFVVAWNSQCYGFTIELRESNYRSSDLRDASERDYRFSLTLKNVGTFLDLNDSF
jgi:LPS-assembly protein